MRSSIQRDRRLRTKSRQRELARRAWRVLRADGAVKDQARQRAVAGLAREPRNSSPTRVVNRCAETARGRGVLSRPGISRIVFREVASQGLLPGIHKGASS
jgi:small subunit ribosomal protein S14